MFQYVIYMKSGINFKVADDLSINDLFMKLLPKNDKEINVYHFQLLEDKNKNIAIIGNEVACIEYYIK